MTVGEKLQQLRNERQMSQEDLAELLLINSQTVDLWENNQILPSTENLIKLKEIFDINIDDILDEESTLEKGNNQPGTNPPPIEINSFAFERNDLKYIYKIFTQPLVKLVTLWFFILLFSLSLTSADTSEEQASFFVVFLAFIFLSIMVIRCVIRVVSTRKSVNTICSRAYTYETYPDHLIVSVFNKDDKIKTEKLYFNDIIRCWETPFCFIFENKNKMMFFVKKAGLSENSYIAGFGRNLKTSKTDFSSLKIGFLKTAGQWLLVGSLFSLVLPSILVFDEMNSQLNQSFDSALELMGDFLFFLPIPVLSVIVGILLNKNKIRNRKNIICGIIIGALLLVYGLFPVFFGNIKENLRSIEAQLGFEFPQSQGMNYNTSIDLSGNEQNILTLNFEKSVANEFEESIEDDERWSKDSNEQFANIVPEQLKHFPTDFFILYNKATGKFCELPATDGKHEYIYVAYNSDINVAYVCEYTVNYEN